MDVVNKPIIAARAAPAGLMDAKLRVGVNRSRRQGGHKLEVGGLRPAAAEGSEHGPSACSGFVLELEVFTAVRRFTASRAPFVNPSVERDVRTACEVHHRRCTVG